MSSAEYMFERFYGKSLTKNEPQKHNPPKAGLTQYDIATVHDGKMIHRYPWAATKSEARTAVKKELGVKRLVAGTVASAIHL